MRLVIVLCVLVFTVIVPMSNLSARDGKGKTFTGTNCSGEAHDC